MIHLTGPKGLGDAIYQRAIVLKYLENGEQVTVYNQWPDVFSDLPVEVKRIGDMPESGIISAYYCLFCNLVGVRDMDQYSMACAHAGFIDTPELRLGWTVKEPDFLGKVRKLAGGRKILIYQTVKNANNGDQELLRPDKKSFNAWLAGKSDYFRIKVGNSGFIQADTDSPCELNLLDKISISRMFDLGTIGDLFFGESCFLQILAEALDKPFVFMFSKRGLESDRPKVRNVREERIVYKRHLSSWVTD